MSVIQGYLDQARGLIRRAQDEARRRVFGASNERLDLAIDTFFRLNPSQRNLVVVGLVASLVLFVVLGVGLYFASLRSLSIDLNKRFDALHELRAAKVEYQQEQRRIEKLSDMIERKAAQLRVKPFFEKIAQSQGVTVEGLNEQKNPLSADNPLAERFQEVKIDMRLPNISIPRFLNFVQELEKEGQFIQISDIQIRSRYGTRMYFDVTLKLRGITMASN